MTENSENDAKVMEVPPNFFTCLDYNRENLLQRGIPVKNGSLNYICDPQQKIGDYDD